MNRNILWVCLVLLSFSFVIHQGSLWNESVASEAKNEVILDIDSSDVKKQSEWKQKHIVLRKNRVTALVSKARSFWTTPVYTKDKKRLGYMAKHEVPVLHEAGQTFLANYEEGAPKLAFKSKSIKLQVKGEIETYLSVPHKIVLDITSAEIEKYNKWEQKHIVLRKNRVTAIVQKARSFWTAPIYTKDNQLIGYMAKQEIGILKDIGETSLANYTRKPKSISFRSKPIKLSVMKVN